MDEKRLIISISGAGPHSVETAKKNCRDTKVGIQNTWKGGDGMDLKITNIVGSKKSPRRPPG